LFIDRRALAQKASDCLKRLSLDLDPGRSVESLSQHEQQLVEIAKALGNEPRILVMDEPTSALSRDDVESLFKIIHDLKRQGLAIIYISHHLSEVFEVADRATVLRDGKKVGTRNISETSYEELIELMVGHALSSSRLERRRECGPEKVRAEGLSRRGFFSGAGTTEVARALVGADPLHTGTTTVCGRKVPRGSFKKAMGAGIAYLTEDRKEQGLALRLDIADNVLSSIIPKLSKAGSFSKG
jgi:ribose transport system ATP-binding protein